MNEVLFCNLTAAGRIGDDLLLGVAAIAHELGVSERRARYLIEIGELPAFKLGGRWCMSRAAMRIKIWQMTSSGWRDDD